MERAGIPEELREALSLDNDEALDNDDDLKLNSLSSLPYYIKKELDATKMVIVEPG